MDDSREHSRVPLTIEMRFRTPSSFLVAYSLNLSRGGVFLETEHLLPIGTTLTLKFAIRSAGAFEVPGVVSWSRNATHALPSGMGIEFKQVDDALGAMIDELVKEFTGLSVMLFSNDSVETHLVARLVRSVISTAKIIEVNDIAVLEQQLTPRIDTLIIDMEPADNSALRALQLARTMDPPVPTVALVDDPETRARAVQLGATEVAPNPPRLPDLQQALVRAMSRPSTVL